MRLIARLVLRLEYSIHMTDAYLARCRGDALFAADCESRAWEIERRLAVMRVQS